MFVILVPVLALPIMATIWYNSRPLRVWIAPVEDTSRDVARYERIDRLEDLRADGPPP
jgi:hypothetical protein